MFILGKQSGKEIKELRNQIEELKLELQRSHREMGKLKSQSSQDRLKLSSWFWNVILSMRSLVGTLDRQELFESVGKLLKNGLGATSFQLMINDGDSLFPVFVDGESAFLDFKDTSFKVGADDLIGWVSENRQMISTENLDQSLKGLVGRSSIDTVLCAPILSRNTLYGIINISAMSKKVEHKDEQFFSLIATMAGLALANIIAFEETKDSLTTAKRASQEQMAEKRRLRHLFNRYVSAEVVDEILNNSELLELGGSRQMITVLFADIRGFTSLSESMPPEEVVSFLNELLTEMTEVILKFGGTLDKYMGDCVMAVFGAPVAMKDSAIRAVLAAISMNNRIMELRQKWALEGRGLIAIGIAVNTGDAIVGNVGSEKRMDYTAIGDTVNVTSRIEDITEAGHILVSESTWERVKELVVGEDMGLVPLRGKSRPVRIFRVDDIAKGVDISPYIRVQVDQQEITQQYTARKIAHEAQEEKEESGSFHEKTEITQEPDSEKFFKEGMNFARLRDYSSAVKMVEKAIEKKPDQPRFHYGLGLVYFKMKEMEKAKEEFLKTLELNPDFGEAKAMLDSVDTGGHL